MVVSSPIANVIFCPSLKHFLIVAKKAGAGVRCSWKTIPVVPFINYEILGNLFKCSRLLFLYGKSGVIIPLS